MCQCLSFLLSHPTLNQTWLAWTSSLSVLCRRLQSWSQSLSGPEVQLFSVVSSGSLDASSMRRRVAASRGNGSIDSLLEKCGIYVLKQKKICDQANQHSTKHAAAIKEEAKKQLEVSMMNGTHSEASEVKKQGEPKMIDTPFQLPLQKTTKNGGSDTASLFTQKGLKGINQDSMLVWENFTSSAANTIFCGVFDGHGPHGHLVSRSVRDMLPMKLASCWQALQFPCLVPGKHKLDNPGKKDPVSRGNIAGDTNVISVWEECFQNAYKLMDRELLINDDVDCVFSGTTAVTLVKQGNELIIGNVGDSRAILGVKTDDNSLLALQLTVDLTPNLPKEAARIRRCKGRVFALHSEPSVKRVWLPHNDIPGLAMARALGDYSLKNFGVTAVPEVTYQRLTENDKFVVLATDGVWKVLSNEQVVQIVDSIPVRSLAAKAVVDAAVGFWKVKYPATKVDDCAVVCLFLDSYSNSLQATSQ